MSEPYQDLSLRCPACPATALREFHSRLCCDSCEGIQLSIDELSRAIHDLTSFEPTYTFVDPEPGSRLCPRCGAAMTTCRLHVTLDGKLAKSRPKLDRCE